MPITLPKLPALPKLSLLGKRPEGIFGFETKTAMTTPSILDFKEETLTETGLPLLPKIKKKGGEVLRAEAFSGALEEITREMEPPGIPVKVPFIQKEFLRPKEPIEGMVKYLIEMPEKIVTSFQELPYIMAEKKVPEYKGKIYRVPSYSEDAQNMTQSLMDLGYSSGEAVTAAILQIGGQAILDATIIGGLIESGGVALAKQATPQLQERIAAWKLLGQPKTIEELVVARRNLAQQLHPDKLGVLSDTAMKQVNSAVDILEKGGIPTATDLVKMQIGKVGAPFAEPGTRIFTRTAEGKLKLTPITDILKPSPGLKAIGKGIQLPELPGLPQLPGYIPVEQRPAFGLRGMEIQPVKRVGGAPAEKGIIPQELELPQLYHGTEFENVARIQKEGFKTGGFLAHGYPQGIYFTTTAKEAKNYGEVIKATTNLKKTDFFDVSNNAELNKLQGPKYVSKINDIIRKEAESKGVSIPKPTANQAKQYSELIGELKDPLEISDIKTATLQKLGYKGFIAAEKGIGKEIVIFNPTDIKIGVKEVKPEVLVKAKDLPQEIEKANQILESRLEKDEIYDAGKVGDFIGDPKIRQQFKDVLDTPLYIKKQSEMEKAHGSLSLDPENKPVIVLSDGLTADMIDRTLVEELAHAKQFKKGIRPTAGVPYKEMPEEIRAKKAAKYFAPKPILEDIFEPKPDLLKEIGKPKTLDQIITAEAEALKEIESNLKVMTMPKPGYEGEQFIRVSEHSQPYKDFWKANKRAPNLEDWKEIAKSELEAGRSAIGQAEVFRATKGAEKPAVEEEIDVGALFKKIEEDDQVKRLVEQSLISEKEKKEFIGALSQELKNAIKEGIEKNRGLTPAEAGGVGRALMTFLKRGTLEPERQFLKTETQLLKDRIRAEARGTKEGFKVARQITKKELVNAFKDSLQKARDTRAILREYIQQEIPLDEQGKFLTALTNDITKKKQVKILSRVEALREQIKIRQIIGELKEVPKGNIAVDYQKKIAETLTGIDLVKPTQRTIQKLTDLKNYIQQNGIPLGIDPKRIEALDRLTKKNVAQMTAQELIELRDNVEILKKLGQLKYDLKFKYNERQRKVALDRLLESTHNIDSKVTPVAGKLGTIDTWKTGTLKAYLETLQPARVADIIDDYKNYAGENAKYVKRFVAKENLAKKNTREIVTEGLTEIQNLGIKELTPEQQTNIMINIRSREGAFDQVKTLLEKNKMKEVPVLTDEEEQVIQIIKKHTNRNVNEIAAIYEEIENKIFNKLDEYILPIKYENEFNLLPSQTIEQGRFRTTQTFKGFVYERQKGVTKVPRTDIFGIFEEAINEQQWYLNIQPELENIKYLVRSKEYLEKAGEMSSNVFWRSFMDVVARRGWSATAQSNPVLRQSRINIGQAVLGYKLSSIIMQPFAIFDALAYSQAKYGATASLEILKEFSKSWLNPRYSQRIIKQSEALMERKGGEVAIEEIYDAVIKEAPGRIERLIPKEILQKIRVAKRKGLALLQWADVTTAAGVQRGIENVLIKRGIENAKEEAEFLMNLVSGSSEVTMRPLILSKGEGARTLFTFQSFFLNRWGIMAHDLIRAGVIAGDWGQKFAALIGMAIISSAAIAEQKTRNFIAKLITGKELKTRSALSSFLLAIPEQVPLFGNMISSFINYGDTGFDFPLARQVENFIGGLGVITKKKQEAKIKAGMRAVEAGATVFGGIPGTTQFFDILERIFLGGEEKKGQEGLPAFPALPSLPALPKLPSLSF